jgi:hypothetical protein
LGTSPTTHGEFYRGERSIDNSDDLARRSRNMK